MIISLCFQLFLKKSFNIKTYTKKKKTATVIFNKLYFHPFFAVLEIKNYLQKKTVNETIRNATARIKPTALPEIKKSFKNWRGR